jgi:hypothetical protein
VTPGDGVRLAGIFAALAGAAYVAPYAFGRLVAPAVKQARRLINRLLRRRRGQAVTLSGIGSSEGFGFATVTATGRAWKDDEPIDAKIDRLHEWVDDLYQRVEAARRHAASLVDDLAMRTSADLDVIRGEHSALASRVAADKREDERLNTDGFPLIALGIILGGLPDHWLVTPVFWGAVAAVLIVGAWTVRRWRLARQALHA